MRDNVESQTFPLIIKALSMNYSKITCFAVCAVLLCSNAQAAEPAFDPGIKSGKKAPPFQLKDQTGKEHSLEQLLKKGNTALVFYRSADW